MTDTGDSPVVRAKVLDERLATAKSISRVVVREIRMSPRVSAGLHSHNGPVFGNVVEGSVIYQIEGEPEQLLTAGAVFYEPEGARIARFDALDDGAVFFGHFLLADGQDDEMTRLTD
jgi:quercetin dioxygenase-like cupin family protein